MGNAVNKVVAELLSEEAERPGLLSDRQFGGRTWQSAIHSVAIIVNQADAAWTNCDMTGMLLRYNEEAFPSFANGRLVNFMTVN